MSTEFKLFASTPLNIEDILAEELKSFGAADIRLVKAGAHFTGSLETAYKVCLWSRTANRILFPIKEFLAESKEELYESVIKIKWDDIITGEDSFAVTAKISKSAINDERFAALVVKDGLVDYFRDLTGKRPDVEKDQPKVHLNLHIHKDLATISLDLSGDSLHRRGYRLDGSSASLKENTAAALLYRSDWKTIASDGGAFIDPMCGGATLPIEAALIAGDIAPGLYRSYFGFYGWLKHDVNLWEDLWDDAEKRREKGKDKIPPITGYDQDGRVISRAFENIKRAGLSGVVHVEKRELSDLRKIDTWITPGLITVNPPYGERLGEIENLRSLYRSMGDIFKERFPGWKVTMITSSPELSKSTGLRADKINTIYNGPIKCILASFSISTEAKRSEAKPPTEKRPLDERFDQSTMSFINRVNKRKKHILKWAKRSGVSCFRIYDADLPDYNVAIDLYEFSWALVQEYAPPKEIDPETADKRIKEIMTSLPEILGIDRHSVFLKTRRKQKGKSQYTHFAQEGKRAVINEGPSKFWVNFTDYLDTGIFLDHRIVRSKIKDMAKGLKFLNLFCYTGTATVHAAAGGARSTVSVDSSTTYIDWAKDNMALNGFGERKHKYIKEDCFTFLKECRDRFDLIFLDPPTFSNTKSTRSTFDIQRDHVALIRMAVSHLEKNGTLIFSNNFRKFKIDMEALDNLDIVDISDKTISEDFKRNNRIHRTWIIRLKL